MTRRAQRKSTPWLQAEQDKIHRLAEELMSTEDLEDLAQLPMSDTDTMASGDEFSEAKLNRPTKRKGTPWLQAQQDTAYISPPGSSVHCTIESLRDDVDYDDLVIMKLVRRKERKGTPWLQAQQDKAYISPPGSPVHRNIESSRDDCDDDEFGNMNLIRRKERKGTPWLQAQQDKAYAALEEVSSCFNTDIKEEALLPSCDGLKDMQCFEAEGDDDQETATPITDPSSEECSDQSYDDDEADAIVIRLLGRKAQDDRTWNFQEICANLDSADTQSSSDAHSDGAFTESLTTASSSEVFADQLLVRRSCRKGTPWLQAQDDQAWRLQELLSVDDLDDNYFS